MRLRLSVQRHRLPPTNILWSVPDTQSAQAYTIARLLEDVNAIIPLEADDWGLDDYAVEVAGYECLHFSPVSQALKDDDQVSIRPFLTAEVRARTLTGRNQISEAGQHLIDGIPFGRPYLRAPSRPAIKIPPRKRQRLIEDDDEGDTVPDHEEYMPVDSVVVDRQGHQPNATQLRLTNGDVVRKLHKNRTVRFQDVVPENFDSEEDDEDFEPGQPDSYTSMDEDSDADPDDDSNSSEVSDSGDSSSDDASNSSSDNSDSSSDDSDSDSGESSGPEVRSAKKLPVNPSVPPGDGQKATRKRNVRRKEQERLKSLKRLGILPADSSLDVMRAYEGGLGQVQTASRGDQPAADGKKESTEPVEPPGSTPHPKKRKWDADPAVIDNAQRERLTELERRKQELLDRLNANAKEPTLETSTDLTKTAPGEARRLRPNVSVIGRILSRQTRPLDKRASKKVTPPEPEPEVPVDPDLWKSRINVSAFECWDEEFTLSAPPFPFKQHWDPASKLMREKAMEEKQSKKRKGKRKSLQASDLDVEEPPTEGLDYGDGSAEEVEQKADALDAVESQLFEEVASTPQADLPALPEDPESLPALTQGDVKHGAIIVFKLFTMNPSTMNPEISGLQTALVQDEGDSGSGTGAISLRLAQRDQKRKEKRYDKWGNRIYDRADNFKMGDSEDEEEDGVIQRHFGELLEAKLLQAAAASK